MSAPAFDLSTLRLDSGEKVLLGEVLRALAGVRAGSLPREPGGLRTVASLLKLYADSLEKIKDHAFVPCSWDDPEARMALDESLDPAISCFLGNPRLCHAARCRQLRERHER